MTIRTSLIALNLLALSACATAPAPQSSEEIASLQRDLEQERARNRALEAELTNRREEIQRMESSLALLRADRELRGVSIGGEDPDLPSWDEPEHARVSEQAEGTTLMKAPSPREGGAEASDDPRITLRLYGERPAERLKEEPRASAASAPSLSQVALPALPRAEPRAQEPRSAEPSDRPSQTPNTSARPPSSDAQAVDVRYREALAIIRDGRLEEALAPLEQVIQGARDVNRRFDGVYWRGEVYFLLKRTTEAEVDFASIVSLPSPHPRLPAALLRLGQCMKARGRDAAAAEYWKRLSEEFPTSSAARQIPQEAIR